MRKKYLAYINPLEDISGKEKVACNFIFLTGDLKHRSIQYNGIDTGFFRYYYYGSTLETVELDSNMRIIDIHDVTLEDAEKFNLCCNRILTFNTKTYDMLASNNFVYNLKQNNFYTYCKHTANNIINKMGEINEFVLRAYTIHGGIFYIELDENPRGDKYTMAPGYIVNDKSLLRMSETDVEFNGKDKLTQEDIDKLITKLVS